MEFIVRWFGIPLLILLLTGPLAAIAYVTLVRRNQRHWLIVCIVGLVLVTAAEGVFIAHTFGGFFPDIGCVTALLTPVVAVFTFLVFRKRAREVRQRAGISGLQARWLMIGAILLPVLQLSAPAVSFAYARTCDRLDREAAPPIISALQAYQTDTGSYPSNLKILIPQYLASIPPSACAMPFFNLINTNQPVRAVWSVYHCTNSPNRETYLTIPIIGSDSLQIYNLKTANWAVGSSFDGFCGR
jgi:hypothetical protein